ncbi:MFS transporter [Bhargavaea ginsengi]|uniref:nitrate/nitrite transporter n=1 Tax=Bhargavaea ginsengi TaxID=426757 RepID=UPI00203C2D6C|nr:nitrate/nitrite transporter [Bhargavaea ginsengi]MCM3087652.1 MFS transporter [Bhargavaea ginsengi]
MVKKIQLPLQTANLVVGFMVWVILSSLISFITQDIDVPPERLAIVTAVPVVLGSILRMPFGYYANFVGARTLFMWSFILLLFPVWYISEADTFADLIIGGLILGVGGAVFSVGVTSLPKYYPKEKHGLVNGIYGAGNIGTAITTFAAPIIAGQIGWQPTVKLFLIILAAFALLNFFFGDRKEPKPEVMTSMFEQIRGISGNSKLWLFSLFYFITFGSFVAFTVYLPNFLVENYGLDSVDAGIRTAIFIAVATFLRPIGGWLADKFQPMFLLIATFAVYTVAAIILAFSPSIGLYTVGSIAIAISAGIGNGVIFKLVPFYFAKQAGIANGFVSMMGGLGGFFPPILLSIIYSMTGQYSIGFMLLSQVALASLILVVWLYYSDRLSLQADVFRSTGQGVLVTDAKGTIRAVNPMFTKLTGYTEEEALGNNPNMLSSGRQPKEFYGRMWKQIKEEGMWQGEIWNKKKNGEEYLQWLNIAAVSDETGEHVRYVGTFSDITKEHGKDARR